MRTAFARRWLLAGLLLALAPGAARADVADYIGKPVTSIRLISEGQSADDPRLLAVVETQVGRPLSMLDVRETVTHLFSLGRFEDVIVEADAAEGGVALRYELVPAHPI